MLRIANIDDWKMLLAWRNDPETRTNSLDDRAISDDEHKKWLQQVLQNPNRRIYIVMENNEPVGSVRADFEPTEHYHELSWTVAPEMRGKGIGKRMVKLLAETIPGKVYARVKKENISSARIAVFAGLQLINEEEGIVFYGRD